MRFCKRFCCLFFCFLVLFVQFSLPVSASNEYDLTQLYWRCIVSHEGYTPNVHDVRPLNHTWVQRGEKKGYTYPQKIYLDFTSDTENWSNFPSQILIKKGDGFSYSLNRLEDTIRYYDSSGTQVNIRKRNVFNPTVSIQVYDISGNAYSVTPKNVKTNLYGNTRISLSFDVDSVPIDVYRIRIILTENTNPFETGSMGSYSTWYREFKFDGYSAQAFSSYPEEKSLLKSIIDWLSQLKVSITNVFNAIVELPGKLWNLISEGLKSLFVPDSQYMSEYSDSWDDLLSSRLGAVYQVGGFVTDFFETVFSGSSTDKTIDFQPVSITFKDGTVFKFPDNTKSVKAVPEGFEGIADTLKIIFGILGTFAFCNGLIKKYDEVMGVEK